MAETHIITRCPACTTVFRASESQLSVRDGQVRCGRCATVFDARAYTLPEFAETAAPGSETPPVQSEERPTELPKNPATPPHPATATAEHTADPAGKRESLPSHPVEPLVLTPTPSEALPHEIEPDVQPLPMAIRLTDPNLEFDFGRPRPAARGQHRGLAISSIFVLVVALALQLGFHFRGDIALLFPDLKPAMEDFCAQAGCTLPLPRRADMMSIESSDLQADTQNPAVMVLSATLRNRAPFAQAKPALELTLTDAQDQPLARRVLAAADYVSGAGAATSVSGAGAATSVSGAGAATSGLGQMGEDNGFPPGTELPVKVYFDASAVPATGYRLYLFYP